MLSVIFRCSLLLDLAFSFLVIISVSSCFQVAELHGGESHSYLELNNCEIGPLARGNDSFVLLWLRHGKRDHNMLRGFSHYDKDHSTDRPIVISSLYDVTGNSPQNDVFDGGPNEIDLFKLLRNLSCIFVITSRRT